MRNVTQVWSELNNYRKAVMEYNNTLDNMERTLSELLNRVKEVQYDYEQMNEVLGYMPTTKIDIDVLDEDDEPYYLYYIRNNDTYRIKIGITKDLRRRLDGLLGATGDSLEVISFFEFPNKDEASNAEKFLHQCYHLYRRFPLGNRSSEWFEATIEKDLLANFDSVEKILRAMKRAKKNMAVEMERVDLGL